MGSFWCDRPVLVTGSTGLLGGWVVKRLLQDGAQVVCLIRDWSPQSELTRTGLLNQITAIKGDVCDSVLVERILNEFQIDSVIHLAAQSIASVAERSPNSTFDTNIKGTWSILEAARRASLVKQIVVASPGLVYGQQSVLPCHESMPLLATDPFNVSKSCADMLARSYAQSFGTPVAILRMGHLFGGGDLNWSRLVPGTIRSVLRGERPVIYGDAAVLRDYVYIEDAVSACTGLVEKLSANADLKGEAFNIAGDKPATVQEVVQLVLQLSNSVLQPELRNVQTLEFAGHHYLSASKARETLEWTPRFTLDAGMIRTINWYREFLSSTVSFAPLLREFSWVR